MRTCIYISIALLFFSCSKSELNSSIGEAQHRVSGKLFEYSILPSTTNSKIILYNNAHYVALDTRVAARNKLFVFLPGTSGFPSAYKLIVKKAASLGYHSIGLMYPNGSELYVASGTNPDNLEFGRCRKEIFDGSNQTLAVSVDTNNCIRGRLLRLLQHLSKTYPTQNWGQYLVNGNVNWANVAIAGHSQGGGHAWYISKQVAVDRSLSFASIDWNSNLGKSAAWVFDAGQTSVSKLYSFISPKDQVFNYVNVQTQLNDISLPGTAVNIDNNSIPYGNTRRLITTATPALSLAVPDHNLTCLDAYVPKTSTGAVAPAFDNAWKYLLTN